MHIFQIDYGSLLAARSYRHASAAQPVSPATASTPVVVNAGVVIVVALGDSSELNLFSS